MEWVYIDPTFYLQECTMQERQKCEIFSRSMGYIRPINNFNIGKRQEFEERKLFKETLCIKPA